VLQLIYSFWRKDAVTNGQTVGLFVYFCNPVLI